MDDRPDHAGLDHQLPDAQHAGRGRSRRCSRTCTSRTQQYSWIVGAFQGAIMAQPICGYVLDVLGLKIGFAIFAIAWSLVNMAHSLRQQLAGVCLAARPAGICRRLGQPGGHEGDCGVVSRQRARTGRRRLQHRRLGRLHGRAAAGGLGHSGLQLAGGVRDHRQPGPGLGGAVAVVLSIAATGTPRSRKRRRTTSPSGQEKHLPSDGSRPSLAEDSQAAQLLGNRAAAFSGRSRPGAR